jgi:mRNA interferase RelE/StbE
MAWSIRFSSKAEGQMERFDPQIARRIFRFLDERVAKLDDPRSIGEALKGSELGDLWKYRVGDYRIIARIEDEKVQILIVRVGNRREVYQRG